MTPLRQRMIEDLRIRGLSQNTIDTYVGAVARFARHFGRSPEQLGKDDIRSFQVHLIVERKVSTSTLNIYTSALRFLYKVTLGNDWDIKTIPYAKTPQRIPTVLRQDEVLCLFAAICNLKHRAMAMTIYAGGLRASELARLRICDIDSRRMLIHVRQGKGGKDRLVPLSQAMLGRLPVQSAGPSARTCFAILVRPICSRPASTCASCKASSVIGASRRPIATHTSHASRSQRASLH